MMEVVLIILVALIIFGGSRLTGIGKTLGRTINGFKGAVKGTSTDNVAKNEGIHEEKGAVVDAVVVDKSK